MQLCSLKSLPNLTCTVEEVWPFQDVTILEERFSIVSIHERLCLIHLPVLHHLQPLRVMPAELLALDLLAPLHIIFLQTDTERTARVLAQDAEKALPVLPRCMCHTDDVGGIRCAVLLGRRITW